MPLRTETRAWSCAAVVLLTALAASGAADAKGAGEPKSVAEALKRVGSGKFADRDAATVYLMKQPTTVRTDVEEYLKEQTDPEIVARLTRVAIHLYMKGFNTFEGKAGILGIALTLEIVRAGPRGDQLRAAIVVNETQPGFPAAELLRSGDRLIGVNGQMFPVDYTVQDFRAAINGQTPGTVLRFTVLRGGEQITVGVPLAGIDEAGISSVEQYIENRTRALAEYTAKLRPEADRPLTIPGADGAAPPRLRLVVPDE